jgi:hypothetical protein
MEVSEFYIAGSTKEVMSTLLCNLETSRKMSSSTVRDETISSAFQDSLLEVWDDENLSPDEGSESSARFSLRHGSAVFFLTQEASAIKASVHVLSLLYNIPVNEKSLSNGLNWNRSDFAESHLVMNIQEIHDKFLESERTEGHKIDPKMWRNTHDLGVKVPLYCTTFASVVVENLKIIRSIPLDRFEKHKSVFFPMLCALVEVQSEEIRELVQQVLATQVASILGIQVHITERIPIVVN